MRTWDAKTILNNMAFDIQRMIKDEMKNEMIVRHIKRKVAYLENPPVGNKINWK